MPKETYTKIRLKDFSLKELTAYFESIGQKPYRAKQVFKWLLGGAASFDEMTDLAKPLREKLTEDCECDLLSVETVQVSKIDGTRKYLFRTKDDLFIEAVLMEYYYGYTICISSQAGCRMACRFCASGANGLERSLTPGEILDQFLICERDISGQPPSVIASEAKQSSAKPKIKHTADDGSPRIGHIVMMGVGEPFDNYENVMTFLNNITAPEGRNLGRRQITVSTCGLLPQMQRFMKDLPQANLSLSLHAPNDEVRKQIMPVANSCKVDDLIAFAEEYQETTGRRFSFEYALFQGVNDTQACAEELVKKLKGKGFHINLIPANKAMAGLKAPAPKKINQFAETLINAGIRTTTRRELGSDISAACGQLRSEHTPATAPHPSLRAKRSNPVTKP
jgi:23S rRNA (adenine2503-C2)-methyltransferase